MITTVVAVPCRVLVRIEHDVAEVPVEIVKDAEETLSKVLADDGEVVVGGGLLCGMELCKAEVVEV